MAVTPKAMLDAAAETSVGGREVDWRNAASRGYYAAYRWCIPLAFGGASAQPGHRQLIDTSEPTMEIHYWGQDIF